LEKAKKETGHAEVFGEAEGAIQQVQALCKKAFRDGYTSGFERGFEQGVAAGMGQSPKLRILEH
jgi:flagellar biosynthesis/type III secretory pathway protein FliH